MHAGYHSWHAGGLKMWAYCGAVAETAPLPLAADGAGEISRSPSTYTVSAVPFSMVTSLPRFSRKSGDSRSVPAITAPVLSSPFLMDKDRRRTLLPSGALTLSMAKFNLPARPREWWG